MEEADAKLISTQLQVVISLLARIALTEEKIREIVRSKKRNPEAYVRGYNSLDGTRTLSEVAESIGVSPSTLSPILQEWKSVGIVYEVEGEGGLFYRHLLRIE